MNKAKLLLYALGFLASAFLILSLVITFYVAYQVHKKYFIGKRLREECGASYLEKETENFAMYDAFYLRNGSLPKWLKSTVELSRAAMLCMLILSFFIPLFVHVKGGGAAEDMFKGKIWAYYLAGPLAAILTFVVLWGTEWEKKDLLNDSDGLKKSVFGFSFSLIGWLILVGAVYCWIWKENNSLRSMDFWGLQALFIISWVAVVLVHWYFFANRDKLSNKAATVNYATKYIMGPRNLKEMVDELYSKSMDLKVGDTVPWIMEIKQFVKNSLYKYFANNIRSLESTTGQDTIIVDNKSRDLWQYILHESGNELKAIQDKVKKMFDAVPKDVIDNTSVAQRGMALTWYNEQFVATLDGIRVILHNMRQDQEIAKIVGKFTKFTMLLGIICASIVLYLLFHSSYKGNPENAMTRWAVGLISVTILATLYGWVNIAMTTPA